MRKVTQHICLVLATSLAIGSLFLTSCRKEGAQDIVFVDVPVAAFHSINIYGPFTVRLIQDNGNFITFSGENKHVKSCTAVVSDSTLTIDGDVRGEFLHPGEAGITVYIHCDTIRLLNVKEDCEVYTDDALRGDEIGMIVNTRSFSGNLQLDCRTFYFWNNPNGTNLILSGTTQELKLWNVGLCTIDAQQLNSDYVLIDCGSQNNCKVHANQKLEYSLTSIGNVIYFGNPAEIVPISTPGSGQLIKGD